MSIEYTVKEWGVIEVYGKFPKTKIAALRESIRKWKWLVRYLEDNSDYPIPHASIESCSLCDIFRYDRDEKSICAGCPVRERTGKALCEDTPIDGYSKYSNNQNRKRSIHYAKREVEFLESLLPKKLPK
mgnify:CR=1 FL=1